MAGKLIYSTKLSICNLQMDLQLVVATFVHPYNEQTNQNIVNPTPNVLFLSVYVICIEYLILLSQTMIFYNKTNRLQELKEQTDRQTSDLLFFIIKSIFCCI